MKTEAVKGFRDTLGEDAEKFSFIREVTRQTFEKYNFNEIQTPIIEYEEFVRGGTSEGDDAISEIFRLKDRGERNLALRYEFTFQLKRVLTNQKLPYKRFQIGAVFRDEPVKGNRVRQFTQCDIDTIGAKIKDQAEILAAVSDILEALKIKSVIFINNRKLLNEILDKKNIKNKEEAIRELDKLDKLPEKEVFENLKKIGAEKLLKEVKQPLEYFKQYEGFKEIEELVKCLKHYKITPVFQPTLARGLAYYTGNVFEIKSNIKETICGGGTYIVNNKESSGISFSIERLMAVTKLEMKIDKTLVVSLDEDAKAVAIAKQLRKNGKNASVFFGKPSKALNYANSYKINRVVFVGTKEVKEKKFKIKDLKTGKEKLVTIKNLV